MKTDYTDVEKMAMEEYNKDMEANNILFPNVFNEREERYALSDDSDQTSRCPECLWEVVDGYCTNCEWRDRRAVIWNLADMSDSREESEQDLPNDSDNESFIDDYDIDFDDGFEEGMNTDDSLGQAEGFNSEYDENEDDSDHSHSDGLDAFRPTIRNGTTPFRPPYALPVAQHSMENTQPPPYSAHVLGSNTNSTANFNPPLIETLNLNERQRRELGIFNDRIGGITPNSRQAHQTNERAQRRERRQMRVEAAQPSVQYMPSQTYARPIANLRRHRTVITSDDESEEERFHSAEDNPNEGITAPTEDTIFMDDGNTYIDENGNTPEVLRYRNQMAYHGSNGHRSGRLRSIFRRNRHIVDESD